MAKKNNLETIINRFVEKHGYEYDYSLITEYKNNREKLPIICKKHGVFYQSSDAHLRGCGCPKCAKNYKMNTESFIKKAIEKHGYEYDYDDVEYKGNETKVKIKCKKCGNTFMQTPHMHLSGQGCPFCYGNDKKTTKQYVEECKKIHGDKYDYSKTIYNAAYSKVIITCPIHGDFEQLARTHLFGHGCPQCSGKRRYDKDFFIERAKEVHGDKYDYSMVCEIKNIRTNLPIICPRHGVFYQSVDNHINKKHGCPKCQRSILEENVSKFLTENGFLFEEQKRFKWLGLQSLDFYLTEYNIAIECQGIQHLAIIDKFVRNDMSKEDLYKKICDLDDRKNKLCKENGVQLIYYAETNLDYRYPICRRKDELLNTIKSLTA